LNIAAGRTEDDMPPKAKKKKKPTKGKAGAKEGSKQDPSRMPSFSEDREPVPPVMEEREDLRVKS